ncbi:outer membrane beta-barrel domain-containing protein [Corallococcus sp. H22C18031201]|uniref:outer membrane beta-barrel domain-containing protein n=1 Tax=Citreicoccus inhibens TaxID=2849499 RepID=UPI000E732AD5|nr:outer membrane beta-barrel domain-containing protein [Citreicoccus inhibens]MBJ6761105.1 outer membrane beta-barrel domain-containing protein [Myxococcaceae bacterium JPH2]MBU8894457.1 outer membrane beta-barrel domain-containing protein [Citreicoccus inhibens]RJS16608.1 outer membrane beta-barrel domain-containing protein [Corallococcus sp. H22C18031201]
MRSVLLILLCLVPGFARAQAEALENPGTVSAVQDRLYRMHHELTLGVGVLPADAFYKGFVGALGYTYHFSDTFAWQVGRGMYSYNVQTGLRRQLERDFDVAPTATAFEDQVQWMVGSDLVWSPLYGKTSILNSSVVHFEAFLLGGGTVVKVHRSDGFRPAINLGVGLRMFSGKTVSFRLDVTNNVVFAGTSRIINVPTVQLGTAFNFGATE